MPLLAQDISLQINILTMLFFIIKINLKNLVLNLRLDVILDAEIDQCLHQSNTDQPVKQAAFWKIQVQGMHLTIIKVLRNH